MTQKKEEKMPKLYELQEQLVAIDNVLEQNTNEESQEILESAREQVLEAIDGKVDNILNFMADCKSRAEHLKAEEERIAKKRKSLEKKCEYLKNMVYWLMKSNNQDKAEYGTWNCTIAKTAPKIVIDDEQWLPQSCIKTVVTVDKTALKSYLLEGKYTTTVDGQEILVAHTEENECLRIR